MGRSWHQTHKVRALQIQIKQELVVDAMCSQDKSQMDQYWLVSLILSLKTLRSRWNQLKNLSKQMQLLSLTTIYSSKSLLIIIYRRKMFLGHRVSTLRTYSSRARLSNQLLWGKMWAHHVNINKMFPSQVDCPRRTKMPNLVASLSHRMLRITSRRTICSQFPPFKSTRKCQVRSAHCKSTVGTRPRMRPIKKLKDLKPRTNLHTQRADNR